MAAIDHARLPFPQQIDFFRAKLDKLLPSEVWTDVWKSAHDTGFMVAGAQKAELLKDMADAVLQVQSEGKSLQWFRKNFAAIVKKHGWTDYTGSGSKAGRAWRTRVIYQTNMSTAYAAGRLAQLRDPELMKSLPYWMYKHNDSVSHPRPMHVAWSGLTLPADDPWYKIHYPPNGWGCKCRVVAVNKRQALAQGGRIESAPKDGLEKDGQPAGIDPGWDYMPGDTVTKSLQQQLAANARKLPDKLKGGVMTSISTRAAERLLTDLGVSTADFKGSITVASHITPVVEEMAALKIDPPDVIRAITQAELRAWTATEKLNQDEIVAGFTISKAGDKSFIAFNPQSPAWLDMAKEAEKQHQEKGFWSTANPRHALRHEYGHLLHWRNAPEAWAAKAMLTPANRVTAAKVSGYAMVNASEFVAEVFAALIDGIILAPDVMALYAALGGLIP